MKKKNFWSAVLAMGLAATLSVGFVGCSDDDEPTPEIVTDNPLDKEVYYIAGKVTDGATARRCRGQHVGANRQRRLPTERTSWRWTRSGSYVVTFAKDGYVTVAAASEIPSGAKANAVVALCQDIDESFGPSVTVSADMDTVVVCERTMWPTLSIPAGAVKEDTEITMTEYTPGAGQNSDHASLVDYAMYA
ncbi:MAG: hypothetical protein V8T16_16945 [Parabacteroides merdae]